MALLDALGLKAPERGAGGSQGNPIAARIAELRPLISAIGDRDAKAALENRLGKLGRAQEAAAGIRDPGKRRALDRAMEEGADRLLSDVHRIAAGGPPAKPVAETAMPAPPQDKPPASPGPVAGDDETTRRRELAGDDPDGLSDADRKAALRRWRAQGAVDGDTEALSKALGDKKDKEAQTRARAEVKRLHGEILKGQKPAVLEVRPQPAQTHDDDARKPRLPKGADDSGPKGDVAMSEANKKKLAQAVKGSKANLSDVETKDFGRWLIRTHDEADFHKHLLTPEGTRAKVLEWMDEEGWQKHKDKEKRDKSDAVRKAVHGDQTTGTRTSRPERKGGGGGQKGGSGGKPEGAAGAGEGRTSDGGAPKGEADGKQPVKKGTPDDREVGKSPGSTSRRKGGAADAKSGAGSGAGGGAAGKKGSGTKGDGGGRKGAGAGSGAGDGPKADSGPAAKFSNAALKGAGNKFGGMLRDSRAKLNELAKTDPAAKEIVDALDKADLLQDAESFAKNPKGFTAAQAKNALIDMPFAHFGGALDKSIAEFEGKYPDVSVLHRTPLSIGGTLGEFEAQYQHAMKQLRVPKTKAALWKLFVLIGVNENTPADQVKARLEVAAKALAREPGLKPYVDAYYEARFRYGVALLEASNQVTDLQESYAKEVPRLAEGLRVRAAALHRVSDNLKGVADWIMESPFIMFPMGEAAWFDFDQLSTRFGTLGSRLAGFANAVDKRKADYPAEITRLEKAGADTQRSLASLF